MSEFRSLQNNRYFFKIKFVGMAYKKRIIEEEITLIFEKISTLRVVFFQKLDFIHSLQIGIWFTKSKKIRI